MPPGLIDNEHGVCVWRDLPGDLGQMQVHRFAIAGRHDECGSLAVLRTDRAEDIGRSGALVARCGGTGAALGPTTGDLVLLADAGLIGEPDFYAVGSMPLSCAISSRRAGKLF